MINHYVLLGIISWTDEGTCVLIEGNQNYGTEAYVHRNSSTIILAVGIQIILLYDISDNVRI